MIPTFAFVFNLKVFAICYPNAIASAVASPDAVVVIGITIANVSGSGVLVGVGITRPSSDDVKVLKNVPIPQGSSLEFMSGNKVVLETADTLTVNSDTNNSIDASLTIMEIT